MADLTMSFSLGHKGVCGFRIGEQLFGPFVSKSTPFPLYVTDGSSSFDPTWLELNAGQGLDQYYDLAVRRNHHHEQVRMRKHATKLTIMDEYNYDELEISVNRTLRVPEDGTVYNLPALFGPFPLLSVDRLRGRLPDAMTKKSGLLIPVFQREALSLGFKPVLKPGLKDITLDPSRQRGSFAVKVLAGSVNVVSGSLFRSDDENTGQDYIVAPNQGRLDGFFTKAGFSITRQFVGMPVFKGYTVEGQIHGTEKVGGIQLIIAPRFAARGRFSHGPTGEALGPAQQRTTPTEMGLHAGYFLFAGGSEIQDRFMETHCDNEDVRSALVYHHLVSTPGREDIRRQHRKVAAQIGRVTAQNPRVSSRSTSDFIRRTNERPLMVHELLATATAAKCIRPEETLVLEPVFKMTVTVKSRHSQDFCAARGRLHTGYNPPYLGFSIDGRFDDSPATITWQVSPFLSVDHFATQARMQFNCEVLALFRGDQQLEDIPYAQLHSVVEDNAVVWFQAYRHVQNPAISFGVSEAPPEAPKTVSPWEMGLSIGGELYQDICIDSEPEFWNWKRARVVNIQMLNAVSFRSFTGVHPPPPPISFRDYVNARLPFFQLVPQSGVVGSEVIAKLKSVGQKDLEVGVQNKSAMLGHAPVECFVCEEHLADTM